MFGKRLLFAWAIGLMCLPLSAHAAMPFGQCATMSKEQVKWQVLFVQSCNAPQSVRNIMYSTMGAVHSNDPGRTQAGLGMLNVENTCGGQPSTMSCDGRYGITARSPRCPTCSAYGAAQIIGGTWGDLTSGQHRQRLITRLGGCSGGVTAGSMLDPARLPNPLAVSQLTQFRNALCTNPGSVSSSTGHHQYGGMPAVSILVADELDGWAPTAMARNQAGVAVLNGMNVNAYEVSMYTVHNLGGGVNGGGDTFLRNLGSNPDAPVSTSIDRRSILGNPSLYCRNSNCSQVLSYREAAQQMSHTMRTRGVCVSQGMAALGLPVNGAVPTSPNGMEVIPGVNSQPGLDNVRALNEFIASGGAAGIMDDNCVTGVSHECDSSQQIDPLTGGARPGLSPGLVPTAPPAAAPNAAAPVPGNAACSSAAPIGGGCAIVGDSIAVGVSRATPGCTVSALGSQTSSWVASHVPSGSFNTVVVSAGSNAPLSAANEMNLQRIRQQIKAGNPNARILWIVPSAVASRGNGATAARVVTNFATRNGDTPINFRPNMQEQENPGLHPASYSELSQSIRAAACRPGT